MFEKIRDIVLYGLLPVIGSFVLALLVISIFQIFVLDITSTESITLSENIMLTIVQFATMGLVLLLYFRTSDKLSSFVYKIDFSVRSIIVSFVVVFLLIFVNSIVALSSYLIGIETAENAVVSMGDNDNFLFLLLIPVMIFLVAPVEEYLFRGILQGAIRKNFTKKVAILSSGVIFGLFHIVALISTNVLSLIFPLLGLSLLGILLAYVYEKYQNMLIPVVAHGVYNSTVLLSSFLVG